MLSGNEAPVTEGGHCPAVTQGLLHCHCPFQHQEGEELAASSSESPEYREPHTEEERVLGPLEPPLPECGTSDDLRVLQKYSAIVMS